MVENSFYFPSPNELAEDIVSGVCRHKYAILIIDDSWNDPEVMGVVTTLKNAGGGTGNGKPSVWFAVITYALGDFTDNYGNVLNAWEHFQNMQDAGLVYIVSHSQTHPLLVNPNNPEDKVNKKIFKTIGDELLPSRKDIMWGMEGADPYFFVYPGGIIADQILGNMKSAGYKGAFTVWEGSLDKSYPYFLPRINGGLRCGTSAADNAFCVIQQIEKYSKP